MTNEEKVKIFDILFGDDGASGGCDEFIVNMNDTFAFACGDCERIAAWDMDVLGPIIAQYGHDALTAIVAVKRDQEPISCSCNHKNPNYYAAKRLVEAAKKAKKDEYFLEG